MTNTTRDGIVCDRAFFEACDRCGVRVRLTGRHEEVQALERYICPPCYAVKMDEEATAALCQIFGTGAAKALLAERVE